MASFSVDGVSIEAIYTCVPKNTIRTSDYKFFNEVECSMFEKTTGIRERRVAQKNVTCSDLCFEAATKLVSDLAINTDEIDVLIFVSQSPDYFLPATAIVLQNRLDLKKNTLAFDINLGCSGYVYGLSVIQSLMSKGLRKGLLLVGDKSTISTCEKDKSAHPLFGDAGTATLLSFNKNSKQKTYFNLNSDGAGKDSIIIEYGHSRFPYNEFLDDEKEIEKGIIRSKNHLALDGMQIFNFALREVAKSINSTCEYANYPIERIDCFVLHQANKLINDSVRKKLKQPESKFPMSIENFGNTSSASIPLTICFNKDIFSTNKNLTCMLSGFGVGLSWANAILKLENLKTDLIEL